MDYRNIELKFERAVVHHLKPIPQKVPFMDATSGPFLYTKVDYLLELYDSDGAVGKMPCTPVMMERIFPQIFNGEKKTVGQWIQDIRWKLRNSGLDGDTARELGRLEYTMVDLVSRKAGMAAHRFLGSQKDWVEVYGSGGSTHLEGNELAQEMERFLSFGHKLVKMKIATDFGRRLQRDVERIKLVRQVIGPDIGLAIDANQAFTVSQALDFARMVEPYKIAWFEEPIHSYDFRGYKELTEKSPIPIATGESFLNHYLFEAAEDAGVRHFQPSPTNFGGVTEWLLVSDLAKECGGTISSGGPPMLSTVLVANAKGDAITEFLEPCNQPLLDYMDIKPERKNGRFYFPDCAGFPYRFDLERLNREGFLLGTTYYRRDV